MEEWKWLEFQYAKQLRESGVNERRRLYNEAYSAVSKLAIERFKSSDPEDRTAGTSKLLVNLLSQMVDKHDNVLEIGSGRGYTCLMLAPYVMSMVGTDVSEPSIIESKAILSRHRVKNVEIKHVSAFELTGNFSDNEFSVCISIDVVEHLHPEDAKEHLRQVFHVLKPGGRYIIIMPNRLDGPHDITREEFPEARYALGFHLNESTYRQMTKIMRAIGFDSFQVFLPLRIPKKGVRPLIMPYQFSIVSEILYRMLPDCLRPRILNKIIPIRLVAHKPATCQLVRKCHK